MQHRIAVIAVLLTVLGAVFGVSATASAAPTGLAIHNVKYGCIADPGHGSIVYVRFNCKTTFTFANPILEGNGIYSLMRINGGVDCLNYDPRNGFVYDDDCIPGDPYELWSFAENEIANLSSGYLYTCNASGNSRLVTLAFEPPGCSEKQYYDQGAWEVVGTSATASPPPPALAVHNVKYGCIADPGHGNVVYVRYTCKTTFTFTNSVLKWNGIYSLMRINGGVDCLNLDPRNGLVYDDDCIPGDAYELWSFASRVIVNGEGGILLTCSPTGNSPLSASAAKLRGSSCTYTALDQSQWLAEAG